jgi:hypothetical protein
MDVGDGLTERKNTVVGERGDTSNSPAHARRFDNSSGRRGSRIPIATHTDEKARFYRRPNSPAGSSTRGELIAGCNPGIECDKYVIPVHPSSIVAS